MASISPTRQPAVMPKDATAFIKTKRRHKKRSGKMPLPIMMPTARKKGFIANTSLAPVAFVSPEKFAYPLSNVMPKPSLVA
jgi:hypothetical protein